MSTKRIIISVIAVLMLAAPVLMIDTSDADSPVYVPVSGTEYTVTLDTNSGGQAMLEITSLTTTNQKVSELPAPVWKDHTFKGWYTRPDDRGERIAEDHVYTENTTLYAHWTENPDRYTEGPFNFNDPKTLTAFSIGIIALALILFAILFAYAKHRR